MLRHPTSRALPAITTNTREGPRTFKARSSPSVQTPTALDVITLSDAQAPARDHNNRRSTASAAIFVPSSATTDRSASPAAAHNRNPDTNKPSSARS